jgi:hypothetical protein
VHLLLHHVPIPIEVEQLERVAAVLLVLQQLHQILPEELAAAEVAARSPPEVLGSVRGTGVKLLLAHALELHTERTLFLL